MEPRAKTDEVYKYNNTRHLTSKEYQDLALGTIYTWQSYHLKLKMEFFSGQVEAFAASPHNLLGKCGAPIIIFRVISMTPTTTLSYRIFLAYIGGLVSILIPDGMCSYVNA